MNYIFYLVIGIGVLFEVIADIFFKQWSTNNHQILLGTGLLLYLVGTVFWAYSLKLEYLSKAVTIFTVLNFVLVLLAGVFFFDEHLTLLNKIGIVLGILSVIFVQI